MQGFGLSCSAVFIHRICVLPGMEEHKVIPALWEGRLHTAAADGCSWSELAGLEAHAWR